MAANSPEREEAPPAPKLVLTAAEAVERLEASILGRAPSHDCAAAEGLALAGVRAASVSEAAPGGPLDEGRVGLPASCVHHLRAEPGAARVGAFELAAPDAQLALEHCVAAHLLSGWLGHSGVCSVAPGLAEAQSLVVLPEAEALARLLAAEAPPPKVGRDEQDTLELAAAALSRAAGRERELIDVECPDGGAAAAELVLVAAGPQSAAARDAVRLLSRAGLPAASITLELVRPLPMAALRGALQGARRVRVLHAESAPSSLLEAVRAAVPDVCEVRPLAAGGAASALESLAAALPEHAAVVAEALDRARSAEGRPSHRLVVAPAGAWGRDVAGRLLAGLAERRPLHLEPRSRAHLGATVLAWGEPGSQARDQSRDLLLAAGPGLLEPRGALALLRPGSVVLLQARARSSRELAGLLSAEARRLASERKLAVYWVDHGGEPAAAPALLAAAAAAALVSPGDPGRAADHADGSDPWLEGGAAALRRLRTEDLAEGALREEVDFRTPSRVPRMPQSVDDREAREQWGERIHRFHTRRATARSPVLPLRPLALEQLAASLRGRIAHPFALLPGVEDGVPALACSLAGMLAEAIQAMTTAGREPRVLARNLDALVALAAHRVAEAEEPWELRELVAGAGAELGRRLGLDDPEADGYAAELAALGEQLVAGAQVLGLRADTPMRLYLALQSAANAPLRRRFAARLGALRERLRELLELDRMSSASGGDAGVVAASLGDAGAQYLDTAALARALPEPASQACLEPERRGRMEGALERIEEYLAFEGELQEVVFLHGPGLRFPMRGLQRRVHPDPLAAAVGYFDGVAKRMAGLFRAVRLAELEADGSYRGEIHEAALADLDWEAFTGEELALVPRVAVVTTGRRLRGRGQGSLSELLRSSRPVHVIVHDEAAADDEARDLSAYHLDLGSLVMAHREVLALSSTLAHPEYLCERLARMARAPRPAVALLQLPPPELAPLRPLLAEAMLQGRACADFLYDPDAGSSWADRLDIAGSPQPERGWPLQRVEVADPDGGEVTLELPFTFADAVALDPGFSTHLQPIPPEAWDDEHQLLLADYLERFDPERVPRAVPFIWCLDDEGVLQRCVVTRELALASRDRLRAWRVLQELAGFENAYAELAAEAARTQALAAAAREREALEQRHAEALAGAREAGARESMERLAAVLTRPGGVEAAAGLSLEALAAAAGPASAAAPALPVSPPGETPATCEREPEAEETEAEDELAFDEPYIDSPLCTTCNECTNLNSRLFRYNEDKQAFIANPGAGTFAELVTAAEKCPAKCIHPGKPRPDDASATPQMIERAAKFA